MTPTNIVTPNVLDCTESGFIIIPNIDPAMAAKIVLK